MFIVEFSGYRPLEVGFQVQD